MSAGAQVHKTTTPKPSTCPQCGQSYQHRIRPRDNTFGWDGYRHQHGGWVYLHTPAKRPGGGQQ